MLATGLLVLWPCTRDEPWERCAAVTLWKLQPAGESWVDACWNLHFSQRSWPTTSHTLNQSYSEQRWYCPLLESPSKNQWVAAFQQLSVCAFLHHFLSVFWLLWWHLECGYGSLHAETRLFQQSTTSWKQRLVLVVFCGCRAGTKLKWH